MRWSASSTSSSMAFSRDLVTAWRIVKAERAATAFDGEGARISGGRWTSAGRRVAYTADSMALATLEILVHLQNAAVLAHYVVIACRFPRPFVTTIDTFPAIQTIGDEWHERKTSAVLSVPSALVRGERHYIINLQHRDMAAIEIDSPRPITW